MILQPRTFQARIPNHPALSAVAELLSRAERCLWAEMARGKKSDACKSDFIRRFGITARQFNALSVACKGKASSLREIGKWRMRDLDTRIKATLKTIRKIDQRLPKDPAKRRRALAERHQKTRRLGILRDRQAAIRSERSRSMPSLCFGSAKLFNAQHHLAENGFSDHAAWRQAWCFDRSSQFFCLGSKDEAGGNQTCTATLTAEGSIALRLRLPDAVSANFPEIGKYLQIGPIAFGFGHDVIAAEIRAHTTGDGRAMSWRFVRDGKSWRVFVSLFQPLEEATSDISRGCLAVDFNAGFLAAVFVDTAGNPKGRISVPMLTQYRRQDQVEAAIGDAVARLIALAKRRQVPIAIEDLDFEAKKARLREESTPCQARMLSAFAHKAFRSLLERRAQREGIAVLAVEPAYTSLQGRCRFMDRYGLSVHHAAALVIGRRAMHYSERLPASLSVPAGDIPLAARRKLVRVTLARPARNGRRHVLESWAKVGSAWKAALKGLCPTRRLAAAGSSSARAGVPAEDRSLADDTAFLEELISRPRTSDGAIPSRESSAELLGGRQCATMFSNEQLCATV